MVIAVAELFDDVPVIAAVVVPFDDVLVTAAALIFDGELATVMPFDDVMPLTAAAAAAGAVFVKGHVDPWFLVFLSQEFQSYL